MYARDPGFSGGGFGAVVSGSGASGSLVLGLCLALSFVLAGCGATTLPRAEPPVQRGAVDGNGAVATARSLLGAPYRPGGCDPSGFDCSGFVNYVYSRQGLQLPRTTNDLLATCSPLPTAELAPGDLVFFDTGTKSRALHVGIYSGNRRFIHSPAKGGVVREEGFASGYWATRFIAARRPY